MNDEIAATIQQTVRDYVDAWNTPDEATRRTLLTTSWSDEATYTDPSVHVAGRDALVRHCGQFLERWPGAVIELTSGIDHHHGALRFSWQVRGPDGTALRSGIDFADLAPDGRLQRIVGFFD